MSNLKMQINKFLKDTINKLGLMGPFQRPLLAEIEMLRQLLSKEELDKTHLSSEIDMVRQSLSKHELDKNKLSVENEMLRQSLLNQQLVKDYLFHYLSIYRPWLQRVEDFSEINPIPSMIIPEESMYLHWLAKNYYEGSGEIVDGGCLLGGSTLSFASGLDKNPRVPDKNGRINSYDLFLYDEKYMNGLFPGEAPNHGDSLFHLFIENTKKYKDFININEGDILNQKWNQKLIELLFIDMAKTWKINNHIIREFFGYLIPNKSLVIHQDYYNAYCYWIHITMQYLKHYFQAVASPTGATQSFLLVKKIPDRLLALDYENLFSKEEAIELMNESILPLKGIDKLLVLTAKIRLLVSFGEFNNARDLIQEIKQSIEFRGFDYTEILNFALTDIDTWDV